MCHEGFKIELEEATAVVEIKYKDQEHVFAFIPGTQEDLILGIMIRASDLLQVSMVSEELMGVEVLVYSVAGVWEFKYDPDNWCFNYVD